MFDKCSADARWMFDRDSLDPALSCSFFLSHDQSAIFWFCEWPCLLIWEILKFQRAVAELPGYGPLAWAHKCSQMFDYFLRFSMIFDTVFCRKICAGNNLHFLCAVLCAASCAQRSRARGRMGGIIEFSILGGGGLEES